MMLKLFYRSLCHRINMSVGFNPCCFKEFLQLGQRNSKLCLVFMYGFGQKNDAATVLFHRFIDCVLEGEMHKKALIAVLNNRGKT